MDKVNPAVITKNQSKLEKNTIINTAFDRYKLIKQVGSGGNGRVFSALNTSNEQFAIKFLDQSIGVDKLKRFKNEIAFCEHHRHKNIVPILDRGYVHLGGKDYVFYVMPLFADTLKSKIATGISPDDAVHIFVGILEGLKYAHEHSTIHRDIKPENILFAANSNEPIICDFGIAHFAEEDLLTAIETKPEDRMANFYYAAPEQYMRGIVTTPQTDIYSAGLILNEMFTKEIPQASGYKKIADVNMDYGYLDNVFEQLYRQDPADRLYPEERILSELKLLAEKHEREKEMIELQASITELIEPEEFNTRIVRKEYRDGNLVFVFDRKLPDEWCHIITHGSYSHGYLLGYDHTALKQIGTNEIALPLRKNERSDALKTIVGHVENWVITVNATYNESKKRQAQLQQQQKEAARKAELEKLKKDNELAEIIANL